jgi:hypothetical protein
MIIKASLELQHYKYQNTGEMKLQLKVCMGSIGPEHRIKESIKWKKFDSEIINL